MECDGIQPAAKAVVGQTATTRFWGLAESLNNLYLDFAASALLPGGAKTRFTLVTKVAQPRTDHPSFPDKLQHGRWRNGTSFLFLVATIPEAKASDTRSASPIVPGKPLFVPSSCFASSKNEVGLLAGIRGARETRSTQPCIWTRCHRRGRRKSPRSPASLSRKLGGPPHACGDFCRNL